MILTNNEIRDELAHKYAQDDYVIDKTGVKTVEIIGASFKVTEPTLFRSPNMDYVAREIEWYNSCSLSVRDIPGETPTIWEQVSSKDGYINSNYGWCIYSYDNHNQYNKVLTELKNNPNSRRAVMIYNRPSMHEDYNLEGMSDFMCTNAVQYLVRNGKLNAIVQMRSNDAILGFLNDYQWQLHVLNKLSDELEIMPGDIYWNAGSLHVYERHFYLLHHYIFSQETNISPSNFIGLYPEEA